MVERRSSKDSKKGDLTETEILVRMVEGELDGPFQPENGEDFELKNQLHAIERLGEIGGENELKYLQKLNHYEHDSKFTGVIEGDPYSSTRSFYTHTYLYPNAKGSLGRALELSYDDRDYDYYEETPDVDLSNRHPQKIIHYAMETIRERLKEG